MKILREIHGEIPLIPVPWARPGEGKHGRYDTQKKIKAAMALYIRKVIRSHAMIKGSVALSITFFMPIPKSLPKKKWHSFHTKRPDIDNCLKIFCDVCNDVGVWRDDAQVCLVLKAKRYSPNPRTRFVIREFEECECCGEIDDEERFSFIWGSHTRGEKQTSI